jgi:hypothetical protein
VALLLKPALGPLFDDPHRARSLRYAGLIDCWFAGKSQPDMCAD